ncbi:hypothetical protein [Leifsonia sp. NPDC080035]|uniref:DUF4439 domain-containing protein n=1 Tax=Leifsonia sp. NPDC080035 TaxID=3143936 RepID=A0AAU7G7Z9_9MICO
MTASTPARRRGIRTGMWGALGVGGVAAVVLAASLVQTVVHDNADADYQLARRLATAQYRAAVDAHRGFDRAHARAAALREAAQRIHDEAADGGYLLQPKLKDVRDSIGDLAGALLLATLPPGAAPRGTGTPHSTTGQLQAETKRLFGLVGAYRSCAKDTAALTGRVDRGIRSASRRLAAVVGGGVPGRDASAMPSIDTDAARFLGALGPIGSAQREAVGRAAASARSGVAAGRDPAPLLLDYLATAKSARLAVRGR